MCLDTVDEKPRKNIKYGYKVFNIDHNEIYGEFYSLEGYSYNKTIYNLNKWYKSTDEILIANDNKLYRSGFHTFIRFKDAKTWITSNRRSQKIFKVEIKNIVASGKQHFCSNMEYVYLVDTVVAKEMKILEEVVCV
jgi:hypothetical protein